MIVVDTNLLAHFHIASRLTGLADSVFRQDSDWFAPRFWKHEFRNVLVKHMRLADMTLDAALNLVGAAETQMEGRESEPDSSRVLFLAEASGASAYDCEFVAVAHDLGIPLVTMDKKLEGRFPAVAVSPTKFLSRAK